jgi:hypothetical protein
MDRHPVGPRSVFVRVAPCDSTVATVEFTSSVPTTVRAVVETEADGSVLSQIVVSKRQRRKATQQEIDEAYPASERARLRREGVEELVESAQVDGDAAVDIRAGALVSFQLTLSATPDADSGARTGSLAIEGIVLPDATAIKAFH